MNLNDLLPHLQYFVLTLLIDEDLKGVDLRSKLKKAAISQKKPAFYRLMGRMVYDGLVDQVSRIEESGNQRMGCLFYYITKKGRSEVQKSVEFYRKGEK